MGGLEAARRFRKELVRFLTFSEKVGVVSINAASQSDRVKSSAGNQSSGFHTWTEQEIDKFRNQYQLGTKPRLALELLLWTGQRRSDVVCFGPKDICDGAFHIRQAKSGKSLTIKVARPIHDSVNAMRVKHAAYFLVTKWNKPFSVSGFGNWFRKQCNMAGLPHCTAHGLRKAMIRRLADLDMSNRTLKAVSGHSNDSEVAVYTAAADQKKLADRAVMLLSDWEDSRSILRG